MNRFQSNSRKSTFLWNFLSSTFVIVIFLFFIVSTKRLDSSTFESQRSNLEQALQRQIAQCYALEGTYPPDIEYLEDHYGLFYNHDLFYIDYISIGSNLYPDVNIINIK